MTHVVIRQDDILPLLNMFVPQNLVQPFNGDEEDLAR